MSDKRKLFAKRLQKILKEHGNIIQHVWMWILGDLGFSGCAISLHVIIVIFRKRILIEDETWRKLDFQVWVLRTVHYTSWFLS